MQSRLKDHPQKGPDPTSASSSYKWWVVFMLWFRSEEHTSELQSQSNHVCRLLLEKKKHTHVHQLAAKAADDDPHFLGLSAQATAALLPLLTASTTSSRHVSRWSLRSATNIRPSYK